MNRDFNTMDKGLSSQALAKFFLCMILMLASPISFFIMLAYLPLIVKRIKNEELVLEEGLEGFPAIRKMLNIESCRSSGKFQIFTQI